MAARDRARARAAEFGQSFLRAGDGDLENLYELAEDIAEEALAQELFAEELMDWVEERAADEWAQELQVCPPPGQGERSGLPPQHLGACGAVNSVHVHPPAGALIPQPQALPACQQQTQQQQQQTQMGQLQQAWIPPTGQPSVVLLPQALGTFPSLFSSTLLSQAAALPASPQPPPQQQPGWQQPEQIWGPPAGQPSTGQLYSAPGTFPGQPPGAPTPQVQALPSTQQQQQHGRQQQALEAPAGQPSAIQFHPDLATLPGLHAGALLPQAQAPPAGPQPQQQQQPGFQQQHCQHGWQQQAWELLAGHLSDSQLCSALGTFDSQAAYALLPQDQPLPASQHYHQQQGQQIQAQGVPPAQPTGAQPPPAQAPPLPANQQQQGRQQPEQLRGMHTGQPSRVQLHSAPSSFHSQHAGTSFHSVQALPTSQRYQHQQGHQQGHHQQQQQQQLGPLSGQGLGGPYPQAQSTFPSQPASTLPHQSQAQDPASQHRHYQEQQQQQQYQQQQYQQQQGQPQHARRAPTGQPSRDVTSQALRERLQQQLQMQQQLLRQAQQQLEALREPSAQPLSAPLSHWLPTAPAEQSGGNWRQAHKRLRSGMEQQAPTLLQTPDEYESDEYEDESEDDE